MSTSNPLTVYISVVADNVTLVYDESTDLLYSIMYCVMIPLVGSGDIHDKLTALSLTPSTVSDLGTLGTIMVYICYTIRQLSHSTLYCIVETMKVWVFLPKNFFHKLAFLFMGSR